MTNGFEFICKLHNIKFTEVARALNVRKQSVACWKQINNGVPKNRLDGILDFFHQKGITYIDKNIIAKNLNKEDMDKIRILKIKNELNDLNKCNANNSNKLDKVKKITSNIETSLIKSNIDINNNEVSKIYEEITHLLISQKIDTKSLLKKIKETI